MATLGFSERETERTVGASQRCVVGGEENERPGGRSVEVRLEVCEPKTQRLDQGVVQHRERLELRGMSPAPAVTQRPLDASHRQFDRGEDFHRLARPGRTRPAPRQHIGLVQAAGGCIVLLQGQDRGELFPLARVQGSLEIEQIELAYLGDLKARASRLQPGDTEIGEGVSAEGEPDHGRAVPPASPFQRLPSWAKRSCSCSGVR